MSLHALSLRNKHQELRAALEKSTEGINSYQYPGYTPLHCAVKRSCVEAVKVLLEFGADKNLPTKTYANETAIKMAQRNLRSSNQEMLEVLLEGLKLGDEFDDEDDNDPNLAIAELQKKMQEQEEMMKALQKKIVQLEEALASKETTIVMLKTQLKSQESS